MSLRHMLLPALALAALGQAATAGPAIRYSTVEVQGLKIFYREAGTAKAPAVLLLHGFPTSSHMYRDLIPLLADRYHVIAPDLPGFGFSTAPPREKYRYTFDNLARTIDAFTETLHLDHYAFRCSTTARRSASASHSRIPSA